MGFYYLARTGSSLSSNHQRSVDMNLSEKHREMRSQKLRVFYLKQLRRIWSRSPRAIRSLPPVLAFGRHVDRMVRQLSERSQHFATFFMRNRAELELLRRIADQLPRGARLNLAILACSKGAEVYSKAWILRSARPDIDLHIHAIDIAPDIVDFAMRGVYSLSEAGDRDITTHEAVRQGRDVASIPTSDTGAWIFRSTSPEEIDSMFERHGDEAVVRQWLREGITWQAGDAFDTELPSRLASAGYCHCKHLSVPYAAAGSRKVSSQYRTVC